MDFLTEFVLPIIVALVGAFGGCLVANMAIREGIKCLLRSAITTIYYNNCDEQQLREFERMNVDKMYEAYKALKGNSFIDDVYSQIRGWKTIRYAKKGVHDED